MHTIQIPCFQKKHVGATRVLKFQSGLLIQFCRSRFKNLILLKYTFVQYYMSCSFRMFQKLLEIVSFLKISEIFRNFQNISETFRIFSCFWIYQEFVGKPKDKNGKQSPYRQNMNRKCLACLTSMFCNCSAVSVRFLGGGPGVPEGAGEHCEQN